jgi:chromosomal replication initiation ATPase DnaA
MEPITAAEISATCWTLRRATSDGGEVPSPFRVKEFCRRAIEEAADEYDISVMEIMGKRRHKSIAWARQSAMWRIRMATSLSLPQIGRMFDRDHTTVLHAIRAHEARLKQGIE